LWACFGALQMQTQLISMPTRTIVIPGVSKVYVFMYLQQSHNNNEQSTRNDT